MLKNYHLINGKVYLSYSIFLILSFVIKVALSFFKVSLEEEYIINAS